MAKDRRYTPSVPTLLSATLALAMSAPLAAADLLSIYEKARASDPQLAAAEAQAASAGEGIIQARAALLPNVTGTASLEDSDSESTQLTSIPQADGTVRFGPSNGESDTRSRAYSVRLTQTVYNHGNYMRLRGARAFASQFEANYEAALDALAIRVAEAYFALLTANTNLEAAQAEEKAVQRQLDQAEQRFQVGLSAITDVHEARARYDASRAAAILAQNQLDDSFEALAELTGEPVDAVKSLVDEIKMTRPNPDKLDDWVATALDQNPTLAARKFALEQNESDILAAKAAHLPTLSASVNWVDNSTWGSRANNTFEFPAQSSFQDLGMGLTLSVPIFEGFATQSRVRQAVYERDASGDQLEQERRAVVRRTRSAYRSVIAGMSEVEARQQALVSAQSALEATQAGFEVGTRTIVDVLISQQVLFQAQRDFARARHDYIVNGLRLKQSAGTIDVADLQAVNALLK